MIIVVAGWFKVYDRQGRDTGKKEYLASHGVDVDTGRNVILSSESPEKLGAIFDFEIGEWVLDD